MAAARFPWRALVVGVLLIALSTQPVFLIGAGYVQVSGELGFGTTGLGVLTALFFLTAAVVSAPLGRVVERLGWRRAMLANVAGSAAMLTVIALFARSMWFLGVALVIAGGVYGLANPAANLALAERTDPQRRGLTFGLKHAGIPVSTLLAGIAVPILIVGTGWRIAFVAALGIAVIVAVMLLLPWPDPGRRTVTRSHGPGVEPLSRPRLRALAAGAALATIAAITLGSYLVAAAVDSGYSPSQGGLLLFAGSVATIGGRVGSGWAVDRRGGTGFGALSLLMTIGAAAFVLLYALDPGAIGFALLVLVAFATGWGWPGLLTYTVVNANIGTPAASSGVSQAGVFFGAGAGPVLIGLIASTWSFDVVWLTVAVALAVAAALIAVVGSDRHREGSRRADLLRRGR